MVAFSSLFSAARQRRCGSCCTITSTTPSQARSCTTTLRATAGAISGACSFRAFGPGQLYHLQADGPFAPHEGHRFDGRARLIDPYARALAGNFLPCRDGIIRPPKCVVVDDTFDWQGDRHLRRSLADTVIYEMHVGGFTRSATSGVENPGTYLGVIEKIPYLKSLGVTAVELMPVHEFPTNNCFGDTDERPNYWGYDPLAFFSPHRGYAASSEPGARWWNSSRWSERYTRPVLR